jgi:diguanylate cyclase (GGDEF)-like protein/PAS domain S-box-containing protein
VRSSPIRDGAAAIGRVFMLRDITPLREREQALNQVDELVSIIDGAPNDLSKATITWVNQAYAQSVGAKPEDLVGTVPWIFEELEAGSEMRTEVKDAFQTGRALRGETSRERKRGGPYFVAWHLSPVRDEEGQVTHWISVQRDVTDRKMREEELEHRATHDPLTGLLNRSAIGERVEGAIDTKGDAGALLYLDLDKFKQINDTHGHSAGDQLLKQVADVLTEALRQQDAVGRIGGDEFVVWGSSPVGRETAEQIAERIIGAFDEPFEIQGEQVAVDLSIGLVPDLSAYDTAEAALADADDAMYEAKQSLGRKFTTHDSVRPADTGS